MSDDVERRTMDTFVIRAAIVFPDETPPSMGLDSARIPVRVVWHPAEPPAPAAINDGSAASFQGQATGTRRDESHDGGDPTADAATEREPEQSASDDGSRADPVASFLKVNKALDRITGTTAPKMSAPQSPQRVKRPLESEDDEDVAMT
jgi:hypothetical protein